jgi:DNA-binding NarL/FixJ family response regulator
MNLTTTVKIIIADDHSVFREGLKLVLKKGPNLKVVGEAENGKELYDLYLSKKPDIILTDIMMPEMDGIEATKKIINDDPDAKVIALSMFEEERMVVEIMEAGARGYLLKNAGKADILSAVDVVVNGNTYISNAISTNLIKLISESRFDTKHDNSDIEFSEIEIEIIRGICEELSSKELADKLALSNRTVENYRQNIMEKIDVKTKVGVVIFAIRNGVYKL